MPIKRASYCVSQLSLKQAKCTLIPRSCTTLLQQAQQSFLLTNHVTDVSHLTYGSHPRKSQPVSVRIMRGLIYFIGLHLVPPPSQEKGNNVSRAQGRNLACSAFRSSLSFVDLGFGPSRRVTRTVKTSLGSPRSPTNRQGPKMERFELLRCRARGNPHEARIG